MDIFCKEFRPYACLSLHDIRFWLRIMKEHALFIKSGLGCEEEALREEAGRFSEMFEDLGKVACKIDCDDDLVELIESVATSVKKFFAFKRHLLHLALECRVDSRRPPLFYDHVSREALYFLKLLERAEECLKYPVEAKTGELAFWTKIMADHLMFILSMLDPSERQLAGKAVEIEKQFDELNLQSIDYDHMLWHFQPVNSFSRFVNEVDDAAAELRELKEAVVALLKQCCVVSVIPVELAEHVLRENEHFLHIIKMIEEQLEACPTEECV